VSEVLHVDIHPAARVGRGVFIDHATGVVIGETAIVGDNVSMLHHVTLGGSGTSKGVRHPHIGARTHAPGQRARHCACGMHWLCRAGRVAGFGREHGEGFFGPGLACLLAVSNSAVVS